MLSSSAGKGRSEWNYVSHPYSHTKDAVPPQALPSPVYDATGRTTSGSSWILVFFIIHLMGCPLTFLSTFLLITFELLVQSVYSLKGEAHHPVHYPLVYPDFSYHRVITVLAPRFSTDYQVIWCSSISYNIYSYQCSSGTRLALTPVDY